MKLNLLAVTLGFICVAIFIDCSIASAGKFKEKKLISRALFGVLNHFANGVSRDFIVHKIGIFEVYQETVPS